ncbi:beta-1,4-galactosyltransferase 2 [Culicoides brevitarsis]|uniref:beta-1,4-galactosyltransferase 2 n=1 Tax=Culicoides brevitarsis TaxID=469753 RepID=UPI00307BEF09
MIKHKVFRAAVKRFCCITKQQFYMFLGYLVILLIFCWPSRFATHYEFIQREQILSNLVEKTTRNVTLSQAVGPKCDYYDVIDENLYMWRLPFTESILNNYNLRLGGEYLPSDCAPRYSTAVIVPYRQRETQLKQFLVYIHNFLRRQRIHYRIFVIEQYDPKPFNRAKLFNIGAMYAMKLEFPCLIMQDVDLLPMNLGHMYACTPRPRHMSSALDNFRYKLLYYGLFGGAIAVESQVFLKVNGFSNLFSGWGGEDDDFYGRLKANHVDICRFEPDYSRFTMLKHKKEHPSSERHTFLVNGYLRYHTDGLNSLVYKEVAVKMHNLFTHILVET